jgi:hypothetical protein
MPMARSFQWIPLVGAAMALAGPVAAAPIDVIFDPPKDGVVSEVVDFDRAKITIWPTNKDGKDIVATDPLAAQWPYETEIGTKPKPGQKKANPRAAVGVKQVEGGQNVHDIHQRIEELPYTPPKKSLALAVDPSVGEISDLSIESIAFDSSTNLYGLSNIFGTIARKVGVGTTVTIPDLYADTNGDGIIGAGDVLYTLVDLNIFLDQTHSFNFGDTFDIANGVIAGLEGLWFSASPFVFDPATGFSTDGVPVGAKAFAAGGFTGTGVLESNHGVTATPEPSTWGMMLLGLGLVGSTLRRKRSQAGSRSRQAGGLAGGTA